MGLRLAYSSLKWKEQNLETNLRALAEEGFEGWETRESLDWLGTPKRLKKMASDCGIEVAAVSGPNVPATKDQPAFEINKRRIEFASDLGVPLLMTKGPRGENNPTPDAGLQQVADMYEELARYGQPLGVTVTYHPHINHFVDSAEEWKRFMPLLDACRLCLDMSHAVRWGYDPIQAARDYADRISLAHLHDEKDGVGADIGEGPMCDYGAFLKTVQDVGYSGWVVVCPGEGDRSDREKIQHNRTYLKSIGY